MQSVFSTVESHLIVLKGAQARRSRVRHSAPSAIGARGSVTRSRFSDSVWFWQLSPGTIVALLARAGGVEVTAAAARKNQH